MKRYSIFLFIAALGFSLTKCTDTSEDVYSEKTVISGNLDVSRIVSLGNSITAGYQSGGWNWELQNASYATLLARQIYEKEAIGPDYLLHQYLMARIPEGGNPVPNRIVSQQQVGVLADGSPVYQYQMAGGGFNPGNFLPVNLDSPRSFHNLAVPGFVALDILETASGVNRFGTFNPLYQLPLRDKGSAFDQTLSISPTITTIWAGNNEVLGPALSGATTLPYPLTQIGNIPGFGKVIDDLVDPLLAAGSKVVLGNVPDVTVIPAVSGIGVLKADGTRGQILDLNSDGIWSDTLTFWGRDQFGTVRQVLATENVLLSWLTSSQFAANPQYGLSESTPLNPNHWLSEAEITMLRGALTAYNQILTQKAASSPDVVLVDIHSMFNEVAANGGQLIGEDFHTLELFTGSIFSLDGVHPSTISHQVIANEFIAAINNAFGANIPEVSFEVETEPNLRSLRGKVDVMSANESGLLKAFESAFKLYVPED